MTISIRSFKKFIILFWLVWSTVAFLTDFLGGLKHTGVISYSWVPDLNYPYLASSLEIYNTPPFVVAVLFWGIVIWLFLNVIVFLRAAFTSMASRERWMRNVDAAFIISMGLWLAFFIADLIVMKFDLLQNHMVQGSFQLLTWFLIHFLPEESPKKHL